MRPVYRLVPLWLAVALLLFGHPVSGAVVISEFMAANTRTLTDEDGDYPDWIEIENTEAGEVRLDGWSLSDDPATPRMWVLPAVTIPAGGHLVVFASGKDRRTDPKHLHTNFRLEAAGGYLALYPADSQVPSTAFNPYPKLADDEAFGSAVRYTSASLLANAVPRILVPTAGAALPADWNSPTFAPGVGWLSGTAPAALGFDASSASGGGTSINLARTGTPLPTATQSTTLSGFTAALGINGNLGDFTHTLGTDRDSTWTLNLGRRALIESITLHNRDSCCGSRLRDITVEVLAPDKSVLFTSALLNPQNKGFVYPNGPEQLDIPLPTPAAGQYVRVHRTPDPTLSGTGGQGNGDEAGVLSLGEVIVMGQDISGYKTLVRTDLQSVMLGKNASAFVRLPFNFPDPANVAALSLRLRYDDGFIAYLNGKEVARRNAPAGAAWNSAASAKRDVVDAVQWATVDLTAAMPLLKAGANVLAFQVLNISAADQNLLFEPQLIATQRDAAERVFLVTPTPGSPNLSDYFLGKVADTKFSIDRGFFEAPFTLSITSATPAARIYFSTNGDEPSPTKGSLYTGPIQITNTTVLRTRAFKDGWLPTDVDTGTYLFIADVLKQASDWKTKRVPPPGFPASWGANAVDYGMDPAVVAKYTAAEWKEAFTQLPSLSIVTEMPNLFDPATGIYANASGHGEEWERPASIEFLEPTNAIPGRFQENCGLRIRGGYSRNPQFVKHSLRVFFRSEYGASKLKYPIYGERGASEFDTFDLRTSQNYSWTGGDTHETLVREEFCEETLGALGQPYRRVRYTHLYLNGQYWGIYEFDERPEASYGATYFGGSKTNFDVVKCGNHVAGFVTEATDGNMNAWSNLWTQTRGMVANPANSNYFRILGRKADGTRNPEWPVLLDVDNLIDYMLEIFYSGDGDATLSSFLGNNMPNNWFGMRDRTNPEVGFRFFVSDAEHTLGAPSSQTDRTGPFGGSNQSNFAYSNPQWMHEELMRNAEYRLRFADHVQRHFFDGGALTPEAATNRFLAKAAQIKKAIRAYSARWGDTARSPALGEANWQAEITWILRNWFPNRTRIVLDQLKKDKLYPAIDAARFSRRPGIVPANFPLELSHTNATGSIYFTTDGSDPRLVDGAIAPGAKRYGDPVVITTLTRLRARVLVDTTWSAIQEGTFFPAQDFSGLIVSEIMYHPPGVGGVDGDEYEFLELKNAGAAPLQMAGVTLGGAIDFTFHGGLPLAPGAFVVVVRNSVRFSERYPTAPFAGSYLGKLANNGEEIVLKDPAGTVIRTVRYGTDGQWPPSADGLGYSLVPADPDHNAPADDDGSNWRASAKPGGSPGTDDANSTPPPVTFQLDGVSVAPEGVTVAFEALANRTYTLQATDGLGSGDWRRVADLPATPSSRPATLVDPSPSTHRFYRIVTPAMPTQ